jgi:hypothetical protein
VPDLSEQPARVFFDLSQRWFFEYVLHTPQVSLEVTQGVFPAYGLVGRRSREEKIEAEIEVSGEPIGDLSEEEREVFRLLIFAHGSRGFPERLDLAAQ